jgi:hypothetical protein
MNAATFTQFAISVLPSNPVLVQNEILVTVFWVRAHHPNKSSPLMDRADSKLNWAEALTAAYRTVPRRLEIVSRGTCEASALTDGPLTSAIGREERLLQERRRA